MHRLWKGVCATMANRSYLNRHVDDVFAMYKPHISGEQGAVSSNSPYATRVGLEILRQGGNAFDAAAAVALALGVVEPYHSGIGGGCLRRTDAPRRPVPAREPGETRRL